MGTSSNMSSNVRAWEPWRAPHLLQRHHPGHHLALHEEVGERDEQAAHDHHAHHAAQRVAPAVHARRQPRADLRAAAPPALSAPQARSRRALGRLQRRTLARAGCAALVCTAPYREAPQASRSSPLGRRRPAAAARARLGEVLDGAAGEDERHVGAQAEQRVEHLGLIHRHDLR